MRRDSEYHRTADQLCTFQLRPESLPLASEIPVGRYGLISKPHRNSVASFLLGDNSLIRVREHQQDHRAPESLDSPGSLVALNSWIELISLLDLTLEAWLHEFVGVGFTRATGIFP